MRQLKIQLIYQLFGASAEFAVKYAKIYFKMDNFDVPSGNSSRLKNSLKRGLALRLRRRIVPASFYSFFL